MKTKIQQRGCLMMMTTLRTLPAVVLGLLLLLGVPGLARAQYVFTQIDMPEATATYANGNSTHAIAGEFDDEDGNTHGFVLSKGAFTQFDAPGADGYTSVNGINAKGDRSGIYFAGDRYFGYFWSKGVFTTLDPPGSNFSVAEFLNARGQVVGYSRHDLEPRHGFVWRNGVFTTIDAPGAGPRGTRLFGINDPGQVVGAYADADNHLHGFLLSKGVYTTLDAPGSEDGSTVAQGINNAGQIVGLYANADGVSHGFVLSDGVYTTIDVPGSLWTEVYSINAKGEIVGVYEDADGVDHGFQGTPAREQWTHDSRGNQ
jgi:probable HAF family extracellular repeat protein